VDHWRDLHDGIILYVYQHPGCTKHEIMSALLISEYAWRDHSTRFSHTLEYDRKKRGWFLYKAEAERILSGVRQRAWEKERQKLADELLWIAEKGGFGENYAPELRQAAEAYKRHCEKNRWDHPVKAVVRRPPTDRMDLLLNDNPSENIDLPTAEDP